MVLPAYQLALGGQVGFNRLEPAGVCREPSGWILLACSYLRVNLPSLRANWP
jgi:hypothetical protein